MSEEQEECAICFDNPANCVVVPCGHQCGCSTCLERIKGDPNLNKCPICRTPIASIMKVIRSGVPSENPAPVRRPRRRGGNAGSVKIAAPNDLPEISLEVLPLDVTDPKKRDTDAVVRISVSEPEEGSLSRLPVDIMVCMDISGSMGADATYEVEGEERSDGLRILDIAIHATKVLISSLQKEDRFGIVVFDQTSELKYPLTSMNKRCREAAMKVASDLKERGQTNIWGGINKSLDALRHAKAVADPKLRLRNQVVLLLTDGRPTSTPRGGHVKAYNDYCTRNNFACQLSCFGFGYSLDSKLMLDISQEGRGTYAFIPVAPVLGTVFTNALASVLSTYATNSKLILTAPSTSGGSFVNVDSRGGLTMSVDQRTGKLEIDVGPLLQGQSRDIVIPMRFKGHSLQNRGDFLRARLEVYKFGTKVSSILVASGDRKRYDSDAEVAKIRSCVTDTLLKVVALGESGKLDEAKEVLKKLTAWMEESQEAYEERVVGLKKDVSGRCTKALDGKPRFNRWGRHYIRALLRAHAVQQCTNKLDHGVQVYGGSLFALMRQKGDQIFVTLPPPQPPDPDCPMCGRTFTKEMIVAHTNRCMGGGGGFYGGMGGGRYQPPKKNNQQQQPQRQQPAARPARNVNINNYTGGGGGGGCFGGDSTVIIVDDQGSERTVRVSEVKKGDQVKVAGRTVPTAQVVCIVEAIRKDPKPLVAVPGGPLITSKHPIRVDGKWRMPEGMGPMVETGNETGIVYNFVLEPRNAGLLVNGYECVTLGHGLKGKVVEHAFYGSEKSLNEVRKLKGWEEGRVSVTEILRDKLGHAKSFN